MRVHSEPRAGKKRRRALAFRRHIRYAVTVRLTVDQLNRVSDRLFGAPTPVDVSIAASESTSGPPPEPTIESAIEGVIVSSPIVFDTGPSIAGWSRLSTFMKCPYLFARRYVHRMDPLRLAACSPYKSKLFDDARSLGTTGHTGLAHWLAIHAIKEGGGIIAADELHTDASAIAEPEDAMQIVGRRLGVSEAGLNAIIATFRNYTRVNSKPVGRPIAVESMIIAVVGWKHSDSESADQIEAAHRDAPVNAQPGAFGFWVVRDFELSVDSNILTALDGSPVFCARVQNAPPMYSGAANPREGQRIVLTRRLDATYCTATWRQLDFRFERGLSGIAEDLIRHGLTVDIDDHKFSAMPYGPSRLEHYEQDGQFACARVMGAQVYRRAYARTMLNSIHRLAPYTHGRDPLPPTGFDAQIAWQIMRWEQAIAAEYSVADARYWRRDQREANCKTEMGKCDLYWHCRDDWKRA